MAFGVVYDIVIDSSPWCDCFHYYNRFVSMANLSQHKFLLSVSIWKTVLFHSYGVRHFRTNSIIEWVPYRAYISQHNEATTTIQQ